MTDLQLVLDTNLPDVRAALLHPLCAATALVPLTPTCDACRCVPVVRDGDASLRWPGVWRDVAPLRRTKAPTAGRGLRFSFGGALFSVAPSCIVVGRGERLLARCSPLLAPAAGRGASLTPALPALPALPAPWAVCRELGSNCRAAKVPTAGPG